MFWDDFLMAKGYRPVRRDQPFLLPPDMREWLPADHPVWLVMEAVDEHLDTSAFHAGRRTGGAGTAGYDPDMLVALLMWAYANGVTSSRRIEAACWQDVAFRVICAGDAPDHVTIARFRAAFPGAVKDLFKEVLVLCARLGMGKLGTVALDGTKITANASKAANRSEATLRKLAAREAAKAAAAHAAADAAEDELFGEGQRGDEVPPEVVNPATRAGRIAAALADLEAGRQAAEQARDAQRQQRMEAAAAGTPMTGRPPAGTGVALAAQRAARLEDAQLAKIADWEQRNAARAAAGQPLLPGPGPRPPGQCARVRDARAALEKAQAAAAEAQREAPGRPGPVRNITDPDSRLMPVRGGAFIQGYNAQHMVSEDKLIIAEELTSDTNDAPWFGPMLTAAAGAAALITTHQPPPAATSPAEQASVAEHGSPAKQASGIGQVLADAGYCSEDNLTIAGPDRLIATGKHRDLEKTAREAAASQASLSEDPPDSPIAAMAARLATPDGITAYRKRGHIAETPHGQIKHNMGIRRLAMRGKPKASAEWTFTCAVHNLIKAITTGHLTHAALASLAT
jgi:transposase